MPSGYPRHPKILYTCPSCGHTLYAGSNHTPKNRHPRFDEITQTILAGANKRLLMSRFGLTKGQASGMIFRLKRQLHERKLLQND